VSKFTLRATLRLAPGSGPDGAFSDLLQRKISNKPAFSFKLVTVSDLDFEQVVSAITGRCIALLSV
jgi:hypothetical protein